MLKFWLQLFSNKYNFQWKINNYGRFNDLVRKHFCLLHIDGLLLQPSQFGMIQESS